MSGEEYEAVDELVERNRHKKLLEDLREISDSYDDSSNDVFLPLSVKESSQRKIDKQREQDDANDVWEKAVASLREPIYFQKAKLKNHKDYDDLFEPIDKKKNKKKKKKDKLSSKEPTDYEKKFETEEIFLNNLLKEQTNFVKTLQEQYDTTTSRKASSRGLTKTTTDLAANISQGRNLSLAIVKEKAMLKKTAAELSMKERKDLGLLDAVENGEGLETGFYGSDVIRQVISERAKVANDADINSREIVDYEQIDDNFFDDYTTDDLDERSANASKYLKFEVLQPTIYVKCGQSGAPDDYRFIVLTKDGDDITDEYPLPMHTNMIINESLGIATDKYGQKYPIYDN